MSAATMELSCEMSLWSCSHLRASGPFYVVLSQVQYVRCLKPNSIKAGGVFDGRLIVDQLRYAGQACSTTAPHCWP